MTQTSLLNLPQELPDNLLLRWGRTEDAEALSDFNVRIHSDEPERPEMWLGSWTRDLLGGAHPTTKATDFTVVEDTNSGAIVSSMVLISQTWSYDGIPFGVGRPELVGTEDAYRRRGLIRRQMEIAHAVSERRGDRMQAITGIPWYYRQFGYEMAVNLGGGREYFFTRPGNDKQPQEKSYQTRPATAADIPLLQTLYNEHSAGSLLRLERSEEIWRFQLTEAHRDSVGALNAQIILNQSGQAVAYFAADAVEGILLLKEVGVTPGHSWRSIATFIMSKLKQRLEKLNATREKPLTSITIPLYETHPLIIALDRQLEKMRPPYAWYVRVPDLPGFIQHIVPVLEKRLAASVMAGHSGMLRLNFYRDTLRLTFDRGRMTAIDQYEPKAVEDADALFPNLTFLQLLFGHRSLDELDHAYADCYAANAEAAVLLRALFPPRPSWIGALN
ncbi:MAG: GNAT family N-acetyltransferase [Candidatus Promineifilaceae bacterium]